MADEKILIPEEFYVGFSLRPNEVPLGFLTPNGTDSAAKKRTETVDRWCKGSMVSPCIFENKLLSGFKLQRFARRWSTSNVVWRVVDPRGFSFEISSENMLNIMETSTVINGEIIGKCIYGRFKGTNVLLHESSPEYQQAVFSTKVSKKSVSIKDVKPGMKVILSNGKTMTYYGAYYKLVKTYVEETTDLSSTTTQRFGLEEKAKHVFLIEEEKHGRTREALHIFASPKVNVILDDSVISDNEAFDFVNRMVNNDSSIYEGSGYSFGVLALLKTKEININLQKVDIPAQELKELATAYCGPRIFFSDNQNEVILNNVSNLSSFSRNSPLGVSRFLIKNLGSSIELITQETRSRYYTSSYHKKEEDLVQIELNIVDNWQSLTFHQYVLKVEYEGKILDVKWRR